MHSHENPGGVRKIRVAKAALQISAGSFDDLAVRAASEAPKECYI
jgi:hypothetical protein